MRLPSFGRKRPTRTKIDRATERARLQKEKMDLEGQVAEAEGRLSEYAEKCDDERRRIREAEAFARPLEARVRADIHRLADLCDVPGVDELAAQIEDPRGLLALRDELEQRYEKSLPKRRDHAAATANNV